MVLQTRLLLDQPRHTPRNVMDFTDPNARAANVKDGCRLASLHGEEHEANQRWWLREMEGYKDVGGSFVGFVILIVSAYHSCLVEEMTLV